MHAPRVLDGEILADVLAAERPCVDDLAAEGVDEAQRLAGREGDRRTLARWIDLGCPIDLAYDPAHPDARGNGWLQDDNRPTLTLTYPRAGANDPLTRILVGMHDHYTGLDLKTFRVVADFAVDGVAVGENLAGRFKAKTGGVWELRLKAPVAKMPRGVSSNGGVKTSSGDLTRSIAYRRIR